MKKLTFGLQAGSYVLIACIVLMGCPLPNPAPVDPPDRTAPVPVTEPPAGITLPTGSTFLPAENADSIDYESTSLTIAFNEAIQAVEGATAEITLAEDTASGVNASGAQASPSEQTFNANDPTEVTIAGTILTLREVTLNVGSDYTLTIPTGVLQDAAMNPVVQTIEFATNEEDISEQDDHGNDRASATALTLGSPTNGNIEVAGDADWFSVVLSEAGTLTVFSTGSTDTTGELHNGTGTQVATDNNSGMGNNFSLTASVTAGTYYIQVGESGGDATGNYTIQANFTANPTDDHGNDRASANELTLGSATNGNIEVAGDADWFSIVLNEAGMLTVFSTGSTDTSGELQDGTGTQLATDNNSGTGNNFSITERLNAGTYYIQVGESGDNATGTYTIQADFTVDDHGNDRNSATALTLGSATSGNIETIGDVDWFSVVLSKAGTLTVFSTGSTDTVGVLQDGTQLATDNNSGTGNNFSITERLNAGTYYIQVGESEDNATGTYTIQANFDDHGNDRNSATALTLGVPTNGSIETIEDQDWFSFVITGADLITVFSTGSTDIYLEIYNSLGTRIAYDEHFFGTRSNLVLSAGTYYLRVNEFGNNETGNYTIQADISTTLRSGNAVNAGIETVGGVDWYRVVVPSSGTLTVFTTGSTDTYGSLNNFSATRLESNDNDGVGNNFRISRFVAAGIYYIFVSSSNNATGNYTIQVDFPAGSSDDHGNDRNSATALTLGSPTNGNIEFAGDEDWFSVVVTEAGTLIVYSTGSTNTQGNLYRGAGASSLAFNDDGGTGNNFLLNQSVTAGTYYIQVTEFGNNATGAYTIQADFTTTADDHSNNRASATSLTLGSPTNGSIETTGDQDWFSVEITEAGTLVVYTTGITDTQGNLYRGVGASSLAFNDDGGAGRNFRLSQSVTAGTYYIRVRAYSNRTGTYTVQADFVAN